MKFDKQLRDAIRNNKLYIRATTKTTTKTLHAEVFYIKNNNLVYVGNYKSCAMGMSRMFDIFCEVIEEHGLRLAFMQDVEYLDNGHIKYKHANDVRQSYHEMY